MGLGLQSGYSNVTSQERTNFYLEMRKDGEKTKVVAFGTPGLTTFCNLGDFPVRGGMSYGNFLYVVSFATLYRINNGGTAEAIGDITTNNGLVTMACNGTEILICDGTANAFLYTIATNTMAVIADVVANDTDLAICCFMDGYFIANELNTGKYYISGLYLGTSWNALDFASAESAPDNLAAVFAEHGGVMLLGDFTTEIVGNNGSADFPFARVGYPIEWGLCARRSVAKLGEHIAFLARNRMGEVQVVLVSGYDPVRISTNDIERLLNESTALEAATGFSYMLNGHQFYQLNAAGRSFLYDITSGCWSYVKSYGLERHRADIGFNLVNRIIVSDYETGLLYTLTDTAFTDNGDPIVSTIVSPVTFGDMDLFTISELQVDCSVGEGNTTGQGVDPQMMLQTSKDFGHTYGTERWKDIGAIGDYKTRVRWTRLGRDYAFTFKLTISDPIKKCIIGAYMRASK
jgi:hypothetical protein